jgi:hypothetical protein
VSVVALLLILSLVCFLVGALLALPRLAHAYALAAVALGLAFQVGAALAGVFT